MFPPVSVKTGMDVVLKVRVPMAYPEDTKDHSPESGAFLIATTGVYVMLPVYFVELMKPKSMLPTPFLTSATVNTSARSLG